MIWREFLVRGVEGGRFAARMDETFVVFVMGIRVNRILAFWKWFGVLLSLRSMLRELEPGSGSGYMGGQTSFSWRGITLVQYWRSYEELEAYARCPDGAHMRGWKRFNRDVRKSGAIGIWHEAYTVGPSNHDTVYTHMPESGLAKATRKVPAFGSREAGRRRMIRAGVPPSEAPEPDGKPRKLLRKVRSVSAANARPDPLQGGSEVVGSNRERGELAG